MNSCSLLIPCHNAANYLPRLWKTVEAQVVPFDEIICYDDGSTDGTIEVATSLGAKVIKGERQRGVAFARNQLAKVTKCSWFHFHDADDLLHPHYLKSVKSRISEYIDVVLCNVNWVDEKSEELLISWIYKESELCNDSINYTLSHPIGGINGLYRKDIFWRINGFNESLEVWEDADLHVRLAASGARFTVVEEVLSISLRNSRGLSRDQLVCSHSRFKLLKEYSQKFGHLLNDCLIEQLELTAQNFLVLGDRKTAREVIKFCQSLGGNPPTTKNLFLKMMKLLLPAFWSVQLQHFLRH